MEAIGLSAVKFAEKNGTAARTLNRWSPDAICAQEERSFTELTAIAAEVTSKAGIVRFSGSGSPACAASLIREFNRC